MRLYDISTSLNYVKPDYRIDWIKINDVITWLDENFDYNNGEYDLKFKPSRVGLNTNSMWVLTIKNDKDAIMVKLRFPEFIELKGAGADDYENL